MKCLVLSLLLLPFFCFSQEKTFRGKIETSSMLQGVLIINLTKEIETTTDGFGQFSIKADASDLLIFTGSIIHRKRFLVEEEHFTQENTIQLKVQDIEIKAVEIEDYGVNSVNLGLVEKGYIKDTPAERKLISATDKSVGIINLINTITGRKRMLKKILEMEKENQRSNRLSEIFEETYFLETLKIKSEDISEFKLFALHQTAEELEKEKLELFLIQSAEEYRFLKYETENSEEVKK